MQKWSVGVRPKEYETKTVEDVYNTVEEVDTKEYEDPDYFYDELGRVRRTEKRMAKKVPMIATPPPIPPPMTPTHIAIHNPKNSTSKRWKIACVSATVTLLAVFILATILSFFFFVSSASSFQKESYGLPRPSMESSLLSKRSDMEITPNHLLTLLITKRKICILEAASGDEMKSRDAFSLDHIESARLIFHSNMSHAGVPVHPLQFQRFARSQGIDNDCHIIVYDRGQMIWSAYTVWIFKLFGHQKVSLLSGGYLGWKTHQARSGQYKTEQGDAPGKPRQGDFLASWNDSVIITYDDVLLNTEIDNFDVVDAQTKEEFLGTAQGALYGHIKGARNIPVDAVYDWAVGQWKAADHLKGLFNNNALSLRKPVIVYCSTSLRSAMVWWALTRSGYNGKIYFGGWPEWVVRAPDGLKVIGTTSES
ncbi:Protein CBG27085 [Caenorhabditis briggsae]|uniref:Rhodanese domain-containing protein n=2 Tax=Caenorhabditis briggsae TaxID=6238 RepID=A0AAE9F580_CAEBR|nr:Protein CBG27085 [Caenorhabditis briggsae]ULT89814.1 hypothetical protein L3Y34_008311 [Caenorhabditis briggsae]UMM35625.1 hypothetical protein L5515_008161 [Caenorhabditis briggsae]CAR99341.1 Protein CBG27085 [Caenorhabditis briggsae]